MIKREFAVFLVVGTLTVLVDFLCYTGVVHFGLAGVNLAKGISFLLGTAFAYFANRLWTFGRTPHMPGTVWRFAVLYASTLCANVAVNSAMLHIGGTYKVKVAFLAATGVSALLNFIGMKWFVFRARPIAEFQ